MKYFFIFILGMFLVISSCSKKYTPKEDAKYIYTIDNYKNFPITYRSKYIK